MTAYLDEASKALPDIASIKFIEVDAARANPFYFCYYVLGLQQWCKQNRVQLRLRNTWKINAMYAMKKVPAPDYNLLLRITIRKRDGRTINCAMDAHDIYTILDRELLRTSDVYFKLQYNAALLRGKYQGFPEYYELAKYNREPPLPGDQLAKVRPISGYLGLTSYYARWPNTLLLWYLGRLFQRSQSIPARWTMAIFCTAWAIPDRRFRFFRTLIRGAVPFCGGIRLSYPEITKAYEEFTASNRLPDFRLRKGSFLLEARSVADSEIGVHLHGKHYCNSPKILLYCLLGKSFISDPIIFDWCQGRRDLQLSYYTKDEELSEEQLEKILSSIRIGAHKKDGRRNRELYENYFAPARVAHYLVQTALNAQDSPAA